MDSTDSGTFETAFRRLCGAFRLKLSGDEQAELCRTYFRLLEHQSLGDVLAAGKACGQQLTRFPKPADWLATIARQHVEPSCRQMTVSELDERDRAERLRYEDTPCSCSSCQTAGILQPLRYVPDEDDSQAFNPRRKQIALGGHWAHGHELARWYAARDTFVTAARAAGPFRRVLQLVTRDPGQEG